MAEMRYVVIARDNSKPAPLTGSPIPGLKPTWVFLKRLKDGVNIAAQPKITEIGWGQYQITYDPEQYGEASGQIDFNLPLHGDRFIDIVFYLADSRATVQLDAIYQASLKKRD